MEKTRMYEGYLRRGLDGIRDGALAAGNFAKRSLEKHTVIKSKSDRLFSKALDLQRWHGGENAYNEYNLDNGSMIMFCATKDLMGFTIQKQLDKTTIRSVQLTFAANDSEERGKLVGAIFSIQSSNDCRSESLLSLNRSDELRHALQDTLDVLDQPVESCHDATNATVLSELTYFKDRPTAA